MSTYDFVLWLVILGIAFIIWMTKLLIGAKSDKTVKFSWGEWQDLSTRAKETLINHGFTPPSPPHASFDHKIPEIRKIRRVADYLDEPHERGVESVPGVPKAKSTPADSSGPHDF
jgi:hypothetical protein